MRLWGGDSSYFRCRFPSAEISIPTNNPDGKGKSVTRPRAASRLVFFRAAPQGAVTRGLGGRARPADCRAARCSLSPCGRWWSLCVPLFCLYCSLLMTLSIS